MAHIKRHKADLWVDKLLSQFPNIIERTSRYRAKREENQNFNGTWPDWCGLPTTVIHSILESAMGQSAFLSKSQLDYQLELAPKLTAAVLWNQSKNIYSIDPTIFEELYNQPMTDNIPVDCFMALPFYCVFIEAPVTIVGMPAIGFYVHLDNEVNRNVPEISFLYLLEDGDTFAMSMPLFQGTIEESIQALLSFMAEDLKTANVSLPNNQIVFGQNFPSLAEISGALNLTLYLCSAQADVPNVAGVRRSIHQTTGYVRRAAVWDVGVCIGKTIRGYLAPPKTKTASGIEAIQLGADRDDQTAQEMSGKRPHMRRAHWHSYYTGPMKGDRKIVVKWLPPIPVKITQDGIQAQTPAVLHKVV